MTTATSTTPDNNATSTEPNSSKYARIFDRIRNLAGCRYSEDNKVVLPVRTTSNLSPPKKTGANRHPGQTQARTQMDEAISIELAKARYLMHDLADHVFGHIVSTTLAKDILRQFINDKVIQVFVGDKSNIPLSPDSKDIEDAVRRAFEDADRYDCIDRNAETSDGVQETPTDTKGKGKEDTKYRFKWTTFPTEPLKEDELVSFMNDITDRAFSIAQPNLPTEYKTRQHRLAAPKDKYRAVPLSYEPDGEDMRPDFLLLPRKAFSEDFKSVNQKYINFTAARMVGESKNKDVAAGVEQMQRYVRGLKRAQPWVHYVLGLTVTKDKAVFLRGEGSGTERLEMILKNGRGCIEFIRILLGLALADQVDLGQNPRVELQDREQACVIRNVTHRPAGSQWLNKGQAHSVPLLKQIVFSGATAATLGATQRPQTTSGTLGLEPGPSSKSSKKRLLEMDDSDDETYSKKRKADDGALEVNRVVFYPICVYGYFCVGILFTASSIRGRGTTVFCVVDLRDKHTLLALKLAWQDLGRVPEQDAVMERLTSRGPHPNVVVPIKTFKPERSDGTTWTTLGGIRGFLDEQIEKVFIENRVLVVSVSELKRPVQYFWGVHDFVRGLRGALLGHEYLTSIGILHRDISENNIVLGCRPWEERGYLIDLDMAILQEPDEPTLASPTELPTRILSYEPSSTLSDGKPTKGLRTGTIPYISYNVLWGGKHTQFDDVESFLYVLLLFFFSYAGPLSDVDLRIADKNGFAHPIGSGRLPHLRNWPKKYAEWADGDVEAAAGLKFSAIATNNGVTRIFRSIEFSECLKYQWPEELHQPIRDLISSSFAIFRDSLGRTAEKESRTEVSHATFVNVLDKWLKTHSNLEDEFSNCPFKQESSTESP